MATAIIILAAGQGTRMNSDLPKVLHRLGGSPMLCYAMDRARHVEPEEIVVVAGYRGDEVEKLALGHNPDARVVHQTEQLGTAHAVQQAEAALARFSGDVLVLLGDTPFFRAGIVDELLAARQAHDVVFMGFDCPDPNRYGRFVMRGSELEKIVEFKDATAAEQQITLCNAGIVICDRDLLFSLVADVGNDNAAGEYYLPDIVDIAHQRGLSVGAVICADAEISGINSRAELAEAEKKLQTILRADALADGVTMTAPETVFFAYDTVVGRDTVIGPNVVFGAGVTVESDAEILPFCHLEGCHVSRGARVGPFARLRPGAELSEDVHVGNFVEIKNSMLDQGVKVGHLTYLGDAHVGEHTNIGAGTVTCNYDGVMKHRTEIGARAFIGSDTMLVAPVKIGDGALTGSGSVITQDVPADAVALARAQQVVKPGLAKKLFEKLKNEKERRQKVTK